MILLIIIHFRLIFKNTNITTLLFREKYDNLYIRFDPPHRSILYNGYFSKVNNINIIFVYILNCRI